MLPRPRIVTSSKVLYVDKVVTVAKVEARLVTVKEETFGTHLVGLMVALALV